MGLGKKDAALGAAADGITFDRNPAIYAPGDKITATIVDSTRKKVDTTNWVTALAALQNTLTIVMKGTFSDTSAHVWTLVSDDGTTAVLTTNA